MNINTEVQLLHRITQLGFTEVNSDYRWKLYRKEIELHTVIPQFHIFGVSQITANIILESGHITVSGDYGIDGVQQFLNKRICDVTPKDWYVAMMMLQDREYEPEVEV